MKKATLSIIFGIGIVSLSLITCRQAEELSVEDSTNLQVLNDYHRDIENQTYVTKIERDSTTAKNLGDPVVPPRQ